MPGGGEELGPVQIPIRATLDKLDQDLDAAKKKIDGSFGKSLAKIGKSVAKIGGAAVLGGAAAIVALGSGVLKLASDTKEIPIIAASFENLGGSLKAMHEGSLGMVGDVELMKSYNSAASLVSKSFAQELPGAMGMLSKVAASTGQNMNYLINSLVTGVGRVQPLILDNLQVQVTLADATKEAAAMFGVEASALTKAQTQAGMMAVVMEKLRENTAGMPEVAGTAAQKMEALKTTLSNLKDKVGVALIPVLEALIVPLGELATKYGPKVIEFAILFGGFLTERVVPAVATAVQWLGDNLPAAIETLKETWDNLRETAQSSVRFIEDNTPVVVGLAAAILTVAIPAFVSWAATIIATVIPAFIAWAGAAITAGIATVTAMAPIILLAVAIGAAVALFAAAWQNDWGGIRTAITAAWEGTIKPAFEGIANWLGNVLPKVVGIFVQYWGLLWDGFKTAYTFVQEILGKVGVKIPDIDSSAIDEFVSGALTKIEGFGQRASEILSNVGQASVDIVSPDLAPLSEALTQQYAQMYGAAQTGQRQLSEGLTQHYAQMYGTVQAGETQLYDARVAAQEQVAQATLAAQAAGLGEQIALAQTHGEQLVALESDYNAQIAESQFSNNLKLLQNIQEYEATRAALLEAGQTEKAKGLAASHHDELDEMERANGLNAQLAERKYLQERMQMMQAQAAEMQELRNQTIRVQAEKLRQAVIEGMIGQESANQQLAILYAGTDKRMKREKEVADKEAEIAEMLALGKIDAARAVQDSLIALRNEDLAAAEAAKKAAENAFKDFKITLPPLPPIDVGPFAQSRGSVASAAQKVVKPAEEKLVAVIGGINESIDLALQAIGKLAHLKFPEGVQENFRRLGQFITTGVSILYEAVKPVSSKVAELMDRTIGSIAKSVDSFVKFAELKQVFATPPKMENAQAWMDGFIGVVIQLMGAAEQALAGHGGGQRGYNEIKRLQKTIRKFEKMFSIITMDYSQIQQIELPDMATWGARFKELFITLVQSIYELRLILGKGRIEQVGALVAPFKSMLELVLTDMSDLEKRRIPEGLPAHFADLKAVLVQALETLQSIETDFGLPAIAAAMVIAENMKTILGLGGALDFDKLAPSGSATFEADVDKHFEQQEYVGASAMGWMGRISETWRKALVAAQPVIENVKGVLGLGGAVDFETLVPSGSATFEADVDKHFEQVEYVGAASMGWMGRISETWRKALVAVQPVIEHIKAVLGLGGNDLDSYVPAKSATFEADATTHFEQIEYVGGLVVGWLSGISEPWRKALETLGPVADNIKQVFAITEVGTDVEYVDADTFIGRIVSHLNAMIAGVPLIKSAIETIKGLWDNVTAMAEDAGLSETITKFFGILDLAKTFEELQVVKKVGKDERRTALSNVISNFVEQMVTAAPLLKDGLAKVEALFDGALESSTAIAEKLAKVFGALSKAVKSGIEMTTTEGWNLDAVLQLIDDLALAATAVNGIQLPSLGAGGGSPLVGLDSTGGADGMRDAVKQGIAEGLRDSVISIELTLRQEQSERKKFSARLGRLERIMATMVTRWEAGGA